MERSTLKKLLILGFFGVSVTGCSSSSQKQPIFPAVGEAVIGDSKVISSGHGSIDADIYIDATTSMSGFATPENGVFDNVLEELDGVVRHGWNQANIKLFKFGSKIRELRQNEYKQAMRNGDFFGEAGIFGSTRIDLVVERTDTSRISLVITDLFQNEGDINQVTYSIKEHCLKRGVQVAVLAVMSDFDGRVYDARTGPYSYRSNSKDLATYRPFYILMFGDENNLQRLYESIKTKPFVNPEYFLKLAPKVVESFEVKVDKPKDAKNILLRKGEGLLYHYVFDLKDGNKGSLVCELSYKLRPHVASFVQEKIEYQVVRKKKGETGKWAGNVEPSSELSVRDGGSSRGLSKYGIDINMNGPEGSYAYLVTFRASSINGLVAPDWVDQLSSENPTATSDANKTLNLKRFIENLFSAQLTVYQPAVAQFVLVINKK